VQKKRPGSFLPGRSLGIALTDDRTTRLVIANLLTIVTRG